MPPHSYKNRAKDFDQMSSNEWILRAAEKALCAAAERGSVEDIDKMIKTGANNLKEAVESAASKGYLECVKHLVSKMSEKPSFDRALNYAAESNHITVAEYLIKCGAHSFQNALFNALENDHSEMVQFLMKKSSPSLLTDNFTLFYYACKNNEMRKILMSGIDDLDKAIEMTMQPEVEKC